MPGRDCAVRQAVRNAGRVGLFACQGVAADDQIKALVELVHAQHGVCIPALLVGDHRQMHAVGAQAVKDLDHMGVGLAAAAAAVLVVAIKNAGDARQIRVCANLLHGAPLHTGQRCD